MIVVSGGLKNSVWLTQSYSSTRVMAAPSFTSFIITELLLDKYSPLDEPSTQIYPQTVGLSDITVMVYVPSDEEGVVGMDALQPHKKIINKIKTIIIVFVVLGFILLASLNIFYKILKKIFSKL